jgi:integrase/recombinase XerC
VLSTTVPRSFRTVRDSTSEVQNRSEGTTLEDGDSLALVRDWHRTLRARDLGSKTKHYYWLGLAGLLEHLEFEVHILDITEGHIASYLASFGDRSSSKALQAKGVTSFYKWATRRGYLLTNPMTEDISPRKPDPPPPERFEEEEIARLLIAAADRDPRRGWAILGCLGLGTRRAEFCNIKLTDINWDRMVVTVYGKGRRYRNIDIGEWAEAALRELTKTSNDVWLIPRFPRKPGGPIAPNTLGAWVKEAARDCGFPEGRKQRSHTLRSTFLSMLLDENVPLHVAQALAGHRSAKTTSGYLSVGQRRTTKDAVKVLGSRS